MTDEQIERAAEESAMIARESPADALAPPVHEFAALRPPESPAAAAPVEIPKPPKVFIALCTRDWQSEAHTTESVRNIGRACAVEIEVRYMMNDGVARARNNLAAAFLESDATILFFLDNDIIIEPRHFMRLVDFISKPQADGKRPGIACALYPKKQPVLEWVVNWLPGEIADENGFMRVKHAGTGAMAITREMLTSFIAANPQIEYSGDPSPDAKRWDLFPMHAENGRYLSEDWKFCEMARAAGWDVWVDTRSQLRHIGKIVYPLQFTLTDEEVVDLVSHRYHVNADHIRTFIASGSKSPGLMGGHRESGVRHWPREYPVGDLHQGDVLAGCYDVPFFCEPGKEFEIIDIGADVGGFARWASKRWPKCLIHCYEANPALIESLNCTAAAIADKHGVKPTVCSDPITPALAAGLPLARALKVDSAGNERDILNALASEGRLGEFDAIMIKYYDELTAYFLRTLVNATHFTHCHQRFTENVGIVKFLGRETAATP